MQPLWKNKNKKLTLIAFGWYTNPLKITRTYVQCHKGLSSVETLNGSQFASRTKDAFLKFYTFSKPWTSYASPSLYNGQHKFAGVAFELRRMTYNVSAVLIHLQVQGPFITGVVLFPLGTVHKLLFFCEPLFDNGQTHTCFKTSRCVSLAFYPYLGRQRPFPIPIGMGKKTL